MAMNTCHGGGMRTCLRYFAILLLQLFPCWGQLQEYGSSSGFRFTRSVYNATIFENTAARSYVRSEVKMGIVLVASRSWDIKYSIESGDDEKLFQAEVYVLGDFCFLRIRTNGGSSAILNREVQDNTTLTVRASSRGGLEATARVNIQVLDMNDLRPLFSPTSYSIVVPESTPLGASVAQVTATDADIGSNGEFYFFFKEKVELFAVHPTNGIISLTARPNADERNRFDLEVLAVDRGMKVYGFNGVSSTAKLVISIERVNEYVPVLSAVALVPSLLDGDPVYAVVTVVDMDQGLNGDIEWVSIIAGDPLEQFVLDRSAVGNEYKVKMSEPVDWDTFPYACNLTFQAKDRGLPPKFSNIQVVQLMVEKPQPTLVYFEKEIYRAMLNEISPPGTIVETVKISPEAVDARYSLSSTSDSMYFMINTLTGVITTAGRFTTVRQKVFELEVTETGRGLTAKVQVAIEDANDNTPTFTMASYDVSISESVSVGTIILVISAVDDDKGVNGYLTYSIASLQPLPFTIDQNTGELKTSEELDFESSSETYTFAVRASDWGSPYRRENEVNVTVRLLNVNDNQPFFEQIACKGMIGRDFLVGQTIITMSAIDIDELGLVKYRILSGNEQDLFNLNPDSGMLSLRRTLAGVNIKNGQFSLKIAATDGELFSEPTFVNVSVVRGRMPKSFNCMDTKVAQKLAEKLLEKATVISKAKVEEGYTDLFSVNRQTPQFESFPSDILVREDLSAGESVFKVKGKDSDTGFNGRILYAISDGNSDNRFNIDMESGLITIYQPLDREKSDRYLLNITIYDMGLPQWSSWRLLTVNVEDVNDNNPQFSQQSYTAVIPENTAIGTEVIQFTTTDSDLGMNGEVYYTLLTSAPQFGINSVNGAVYVAGQLDRENVSDFTLKIEARDKAERGNQRFSVTTLRLYLEDVNDCAPVFIPSSYSCRILEDLPGGTVVAWLQTQDLDLGPGGMVKYSLTNNFNGTFEVHVDSGAVRVAKELDYERQQFYNLTVVAEDGGLPTPLRSFSYVEVEVVDVNENLYEPYFLDFALKAMVKENSRLGTSVGQVAARDDDTGRDGVIRYSINAGSGLGRFSIDEETGVIYTTGILDCETKDSYWLTVHATDRGVVPLSASIEVFIQVEDVNDNAPLTSDPVYHPSVRENSPKDVTVIRIQSQDPDFTAYASRLTYRITGGNPQNFFAIDGNTGLITTTSRKLDREQQAEHFLEVTVMDGAGASRQSTVWVIVHVQDENDNKPKFPETVYRISLPERDRNRRGDPIYRVFAYDQDYGPNSDLTYSIVDGNEDSKFVIDSKTAMVSSRKMVTAGSYDILTIKAIDNGSPSRKWSTTRLHIEWIRKPVPSPVPLLFTAPSYNFTVPENAKVSDAVGVVPLRQTGTPLWFDIISGRTSREMFYIPQNTCGRNCSADSGNYDGPFDIQKGIGTIVIARPLDAEVQSLYNMTVQVTDGTNTVSTQVSIRISDNNDNAPVFSQPTYGITVSEDTPADTEVLRVRATDADERAKLTYSIHGSVDPASMRLFRINPGTGAVYTVDRLDHEARTQHILTIMVKDQEFPYYRDLARIFVAVEDANDQPPYFTSAVYSGVVFESAAVGTPVLQLTALDKDKGRNAELLYSIEAGNTGGAFGIDSVSGIISVARELDLSTVGYHVVTVRVTDNGVPALSVTAMVRITVTLSDFSSPKFTQLEYQSEITENVVVGTSIAAIGATSRSTLVYDITQGNGEGRFGINSYTGIITTRKLLDYEATASYALVIQAINMVGVKSNATVTVQVLDENDNPPVFKRLDYTGSVSEAAPINSVVTSEDGSPLVIWAADADRNQNALLVFQIVEDTAKMFFTVDSNTGSVRTIAKLDYETFAEFYFQVHVRDSGQPQLMADSPAKVTIKVLNTNDSPPKFSRDSYEAVLLLPTYVGVEVLRVEASDPDLSTGVDLTYSLADGTLEHFSIEPATGVLMVRNNKLSKDRYRFNVKASDGRFSCAALVTVVVREAMDSGLLFGRPPYASSVLENSTNITVVTVVNAVGNHLNEPLKYELLNAGASFAIWPMSGVILTTGVPFDREEQESYELVVQASREYDRLRVARVTVRVQVEDVNDNAPEFVGLPYYATVQVDAQPDSPVFRVSTTDRDKGINGQVSYMLKEEYRYFEVNPLTGELILKSAFEADLSNVEYQVVILARDAGYPSLSTAVEVPVTVVNKAMPTFDKPFYGITVREDITVLTPILSINATSPEGQNIIYTIMDGDASLQFDIGFDTGVISVIYPLDYEVSPYYRLTVRSTDTLTGARSEVDVDIAVVDVNDNSPVFENASYSTTLSENSMIGTAMLQLVATDKDSEKNSVIRYQILSDAFNSTDYFHIDSSSGLVLTARLLDYELAQRYSFIVRATDSGSPALSSEIVVTVSVSDTNDNPPAFNRPFYEAFVSELAPRGHFVTCVQASDADSLDAGRLRYAILSGDVRMNFVVDSETGIISLSSPRQQGMRLAYSLYVSVSDGVFTNTAQVSVRVLGANLYSPVFSQRFYLAEVRENDPVGSRVIQVRAMDEDTGLFGQITYSFTNDLGKSQFAIGGEGLITTLQKLDRESPVNWDIVLTVMALDGGGRASFCTVRVMLADENDNAPRFHAVEYRLSVKANVAIGSFITQIQAQDPDAGANGRVSYSLYSEARLPLVDMLEIEAESGWMVTKGSLAHLHGTVLSFFVKATDGGAPAKHSLVSAFINVLPPNANVPSFTQPQYSFTVPEDMLTGTALGSIYLGPGQTATFSVVNGETVESNQGATFLVERETGVLRLVNTLDYEAVSIFRFKVSAAMREALVEHISVVDVEVKVLDVNDNRPAFETSSYVAMVMEGMPVGTRVIQVRALDPDWGSNGQVTYSLEPTQPKQERDSTTGSTAATAGAMFAIDSKTGWITTLGDLDHEACPSYTFSVLASDLGEAVSLSSTAVVTVAIADINDNPPVFERDSYRGAVRESDPLGEVVLILGTRDRDSSDQNRLVSFHITGGNQRGAFALSQAQGECKVLVRRFLDREKQDRYLLNITASDGLFVTTVEVEVTVMDANDNSPICDQALYEVSFPEDVPINKGILTVGATDADIETSSEIQYSLFGIGVEDFYMDANSGKLKTASLMDRERTAGYKLIAQAMDGGGLFCRSEITLTVLDVNDNAPSFSFTQFLASVYESASPKALITRLQANDPDEGPNRRVVYSLLDSADGVFSIDTSSGVVVLEKPLDRELQDSYRLRVQASDQGGALGSLFSQVELTIVVLDVNDNPPVFQKPAYAATVPEDVAMGTEVLRVVATSDDIGVNAKIFYTICSGNELGRFSIEQDTGTISVTDDLDFEVCREFFLKVEAWDGGTPPLSAVTMVTIELMDVNDNSPSFTEDIYNVLVSEDAAIGETVSRLLAKDLDSQVNGRITYSILRGDHRNQFWIDPVTGLLKVNKQLDREMVSSYSLVVQAFDSGSPAMSSTVAVNIDIADVNDNPPLFSPSNATAIIQLNKPVSATILKMSVTDKDSPRNGPPFEFRILSGNEDDTFSLDQTGELRSNRVFGSEASREYTLEIQAWDSGRPSLSSTSFVFVRVIGDNLFKPAAFPLEITIVTATDTFPGGVIGRIHATDRDEDDVLSFTQRPQQPSGLFKINRRDGTIVALGVLEPGRYLLNVTVSDGRFSVNVDVTVLVEQATEEMMQGAVTLRFQGISPEDFVGQHLHEVRRVLRGVVGGGAEQRMLDPLHVLAVQPVGRTSQLDLLVAAEAAEGGFYAPGELALRLGRVREQLGGGAPRLTDVLDQSCSGGLECGESRACEQSLGVDVAGDLVSYSTPRVSLVTPRFRHTESCSCPGGTCPTPMELCDGQACPGDMQCVRTGSTAPSTCQCLPDWLEQCAGQTSLSFAGNSYIKYRLSESSKSGDMKLGLRIRTLQNRGVVMYTRAEPCTMLKIEDGHLWFQPDCDSGLDVLAVSGRPVNDGRWHSVGLELTANSTLLSLDDSYVERRRPAARSPGRLWPLEADGSLFFGAQVLNGKELPLQNKRSRYAEVAGQSEVKLGCVLYPDPCGPRPCRNGGVCTGLPSGAFGCSCAAQFTGVSCETEVTSCVANPCENGGECRPAGSGFLCGCPRGFTGLTCDEDVDECERQEQCENAGICVNTFGAFYCNCSGGESCGPDTHAGALSYVGPGELAGIGVLLFVVLVLLTLLAAFRKKLLHKDWARGEAVGISKETNYALHKMGVGTEGIAFKAVRVSADPHGFGGLGGLYGPDSRPPQAHVRPTAYTLPRSQDDDAGPWCEPDKMAAGGALATLSCPLLMSSFQTEVPHILRVARQGVAVCSVAPNLPPLSPCHSERSPVRKAPWEEEEEEEEEEDGDMVLGWEPIRAYETGESGQRDRTQVEVSNLAEEVTCFSDSNSEVHSLDSCDTASIVTVIRLANDAVDTIENEAHRWESTNWIPESCLPGMEGTLPYRSRDLSSARLGGNASNLPTDYHLGGSAHNLETDYHLDGSTRNLPTDYHLGGSAHNLENLETDYHLGGSTRNLPTDYHLGGSARNVETDYHLGGSTRNLPTDYHPRGSTRNLPTDYHLGGSAHNVETDYHLGGSTRNLPTDYHPRGSTRNLPTDYHLGGSARNLETDYHPRGSTRNLPTDYHLGGSTRNLQTNYHPRGYEGGGNFQIISYNRGECSSPIYEEYHDQDPYDTLPATRPLYLGCVRQGQSQPPLPAPAPTLRIAGLGRRSPSPPLQAGESPSDWHADGESVAAVLSDSRCPRKPRSPRKSGPRPGGLDNVY